MRTINPIDDILANDSPAWTVLFLALALALALAVRFA